MFFHSFANIMEHDANSQALQTSPYEFFVLMDSVSYALIGKTLWNSIYWMFFPKEISNTTTSLINTMLEESCLWWCYSIEYFSYLTKALSKL